MVNTKIQITKEEDKIKEVDKIINELILQVELLTEIIIKMREVITIVVKEIIIMKKDLKSMIKINQVTKVEDLNFHKDQLSPQLAYQLILKKQELKKLVSTQTNSV